MQTFPRPSTPRLGVAGVDCQISAQGMQAKTPANSFGKGTPGRRPLELIGVSKASPLTAGKVKRRRKTGGGENDDPQYLNLMILASSKEHEYVTPQRSLIANDANKFSTGSNPIEPILLTPQNNRDCPKDDISVTQASSFRSEDALCSQVLNSDASQEDDIQCTVSTPLCAQMPMDSPNMVAIGRLTNTEVLEMQLRALDAEDRHINELHAGLNQAISLLSSREPPLTDDEKELMDLREALSSAVDKIVELDLAVQSATTKNQLEAQNAAASLEREAAAKQAAQGLREEMEILREELSTARDESDVAEGECERIASDRERLEEEVLVLRQKLEAACEVHKEEGERLRVELSSASDRYERLLEASVTSRRECGHLQGAILAISGERDVLGSECLRLEGEVMRLGQESRNLTGRLERASEQCARLEGEKDKMRGELAHAMEGLAAGKVAVDSMELELEEGRRELLGVREELAKALADVKRLVEEKKGSDQSMLSTSSRPQPKASVVGMPRCLKKRRGAGAFEYSVGSPAATRCEADVIVKAMRAQTRPVETPGRAGPVDEEERPRRVAEEEDKEDIIVIDSEPARVSLESVIYLGDCRVDAAEMQPQYKAGDCVMLKGRDEASGRLEEWPAQVVDVLDCDGTDCEYLGQERHKCGGHLQVRWLTRPEDVYKVRETTGRFGRPKALHKLHSRELLPDLSLEPNLQHVTSVKHAISVVHKDEYNEAKGMFAPNLYFYSHVLYDQEKRLARPAENKEHIFW